MRVIDLNTISLVGGSGIAEAKIPLWFCDGANITTTATTGQYISDGSTGLSSSPTGSAHQLFILSSTWPVSTKLAFEATIASGLGSVAVYASLMDMTTGGTTISSVNTQSISVTTIRSSTFNLTPGHAYGITFYTTNASYSAYLVDASLIIFP